MAPPPQRTHPTGTTHLTLLPPGTLLRLRSLLLLWLVVSRCDAQIAGISPRLQSLIESMLDPQPMRRPTASQVLLTAILLLVGTQGTTNTHRHPPFATFNRGAGLSAPKAILDMPPNALLRIAGACRCRRPLLHQQCGGQRGALGAARQHEQAAAAGGQRRQRPTCYRITATPRGRSHFRPGFSPICSWRLTFWLCAVRSTDATSPRATRVGKERAVHDELLTCSSRPHCRRQRTRSKACVSCGEKGGGGGECLYVCA